MAFRFALAGDVHLVFEFFFFAFAEGGLGKFVELELEKILLRGEVFRPGLRLVYLGKRRVPGVPRAGISGEEFGVACVIVEHLGMRAYVA